MRATLLWLMALLVTSTLLGRSATPATPARLKEYTQRYGEYRVVQQTHPHHQQCQIFHKGRLVFETRDFVLKVSELRNLTGHGVATW